MRRISLALPMLFVLTGSQDATAPGDVHAAQALTASSLASPSPITIICTAGFPPSCEVKIKPRP